METFVQRRAGVDVHEDLVVAHARLPGHGRARRGEAPTFGTTRPQVLALRDWLVPVV